jgi:hypothetical protein
LLTDQFTALGNTIAVFRRATVSVAGCAVLLRLAVVAIRISVFAKEALSSDTDCAAICLADFASRVGVCAVRRRAFGTFAGSTALLFSAFVAVLIVSSASLAVDTGTDCAVFSNARFAMSTSADHGWAINTSASQAHWVSACVTVGLFGLASAILNVAIASLAVRSQAGGAFSSNALSGWAVLCARVGLRAAISRARLRRAV